LAVFLSVGIHGEISQNAFEALHPQKCFNMMPIRVNRTLLSPLAQTSYVSAKGSDNSVSLGNLIDPFALTPWHEKFVLDAENTQMAAETTNRVYLLIVMLKSGHNGP
jgi:hypothetical protein